MVILLAGGSSVGSISQLITVILIFLFVLAITVFATRYVGEFQKMQGVNRNLEVIETLRVTNNKYLQIVRTANKYVVIAIGKDEISMITEIDEDELIKVSSEKGTSLKESFSDIISKAGIKHKSNNNE